VRPVRVLRYCVEEEDDRLAPLLTRLPLLVRLPLLIRLPPLRVPPPTRVALRSRRLNGTPSAKMKERETGKIVSEKR
jgi:hypothetical protein